MWGLKPTQLNTKLHPCLQNPLAGMHVDIPDVVEVAEICLLMSRSQSDTERMGKTAKRVSEGRFEGKYDEQKDDGKDRAKKVFIIENAVPLQFFPASLVAERWMAKQLHKSFKKVKDAQSLTVRRLHKRSRKLKFMFAGSE